jgi:hypothetical protein
MAGGHNKTPAPTGTRPRSRARTQRRHHAVKRAKPKTVKLTLVPTGNVYVCLVNGAGTKLINQQTYTTGSTIPTESASKLLLTLGNASVQIKVNGHSVPVTASSSAIRLAIDPSGTHPVPLSTKPTCP